MVVIPKVALTYFLIYLFIYLLLLMTKFLKQNNAKSHHAKK